MQNLIFQHHENSSNRTFIHNNEMWFNKQETFFEDEERLPTGSLLMGNIFF